MCPYRLGHDRGALGFFGGGILLWGLLCRHFDLGPSSSKIRVLNYTYRWSGLDCADASTGLTQPNNIPGSIGQVSLVNKDGMSWLSKPPPHSGGRR